MKRLFLALWLLVLTAIPAAATVAVETNRIAYTCNGALTTFTYPFKVYADGDLQVIKKVTATLAETTLTLNTDYTVTGAGNDAGGTVKLASGATCGSGYTVTILRNLQLLQSTDWVDGEAFSAESIEDAIDKATILLQQLAEKDARSLRLKTASGVTNPTLEDPAAGEYLRWNTGGTGVESTTAVSTTGSYTASGTGAVARTVDSKLGESVSVLDFGAKGDGVTDDTAAINLALAASSRVLIPKTTATYLVTAALTPISNQVITIEGEIKTAQPVAAAFNIFSIATKSNVKIIGKGGKITGDGSTDALYGIYGTANTDISIEELEIASVDRGVWLRTSSRVAIRKNYVHDVESRGILIGSGGDATIYDIAITDNQVITVTNGRAIETDDAERIVISGNLVRDVDKVDTVTCVGILVYHGKHAAVTGNSLYDIGPDSDGLVIYEGAGDNNVVTGNTVNTSGVGTGSGIQVSNNPNTAVVGNSINGDWKYSLWIDGTSNYVSAVGNTITGGAHATAKSVFVSARSGSSPSHLTITGNVIQTTTAGGEAIAIDDLASQVMIASNVIRGSAIAITLTGSTGGVGVTDIDIIGNIIDRFTVRGVDIGEYANYVRLKGNFIDTNGAGGAVSIRVQNDAVTHFSDYIWIYDDNKLVQATSLSATATNVYMTRTGSVVWNPGSLADGVGETSAGITVAGAKFGDFVLVSAPYDLQDMIVTGYVQAAGKVEIRLQNESGGAIDLASGTWTVKVRQF